MVVSLILGRLSPLGQRINNAEQKHQSSSVLKERVVFNCGFQLDSVTNNLFQR